MKMPEHHPLISKAKLVITSCTTIQQMAMAMNYIELVEKRFGYNVHTGLHEIWLNHMRIVLRNKRTNRQMMLIEG